MTVFKKLYAGFTYINIEYGSDDTNKISSSLLLLNIFYDRYFNRIEHINEEIIILLIIREVLILRGAGF